MSCISIKYVSGADNAMGTHLLMFGVSKENFKEIKNLGELESDWSIHLEDGCIYHNEVNKDNNKLEE